MLDFKTLPHQQDFIRSKQNAMLVGGFGSGKSEAGVIKTIIKKLEYPQHKVAYYLPSYPLIRDIAFGKFTEMLDNIGLKYRLNRSDKELFINGFGSVIFRTLSEPDSIVGYEVAYSLIDEADILPADKMDNAYNKILARNRSIDGANVDMVSTPEGFGFLYSKANSGHFNVVNAKTTDNKFVPDSYITNLKEQYTPELLEAYLNGKFVNLTSGTVYEYFNRKEHNTDEILSENETIHIGQDFNIGGCCSVVFSVRANTTIVVDEFSSHDTQDIVNNINKRYPNRDIILYPDASGYAGKTNASLSDIDMLRNAGFKINAPRKNGRVKDRVNTVNNLLSKGRILINVKNCPNVTKALEQQAYDKNGEPEKFNGASTVDDWNDALGYFVVRTYHKPNNVDLRVKIG